MTSELKVGLVGVPRGSGFIRAFQTVNETALVAICDINNEILNQVGNQHGVEERYTDFEKMAKSDLDVILVSTPMPLHVPQAVIALSEGKHVSPKFLPQQILSSVGTSSMRSKRVGKSI